ncbi:MAG: DUF4337 domain-containing protein [Magnetococcales bacterium]|nr:DUF4337 domain-containing protein [Magnetococcales bacterium]
MDASELADQIKEMKKENAASEVRERWVAVYISILAVLLALTSLGGSNAAKDTLTNAIAASDAHNFFQAKNIRQTMYKMGVEELEAELASGKYPPETQDKLRALADKYKSTVQRYESEPETGEGKKELLAKAKELEAARNLGQQKDPYFDLAEAGLQIAVVLASVSLVTEIAALLWFSMVLASGAFILMIGGFTLLFPMPF